MSDLSATIDGRTPPDTQMGSGEPALTTPFGRRAFIAGASGAIAGAALLPSITSAADRAYSAFSVVTPTRLVDTRPEKGNFGYTRLNSTTIRIQVTGRTINGSTETVPGNSSAAVFTLVGINRSDTRNYLAAFPTGTAWNQTANLNMTGRNNVSPNLVTVKLGTNGYVDVLAFAAADIVLDLVGVYAPTDQAVDSGSVRSGRYKLLPVPQRALDTRSSGGAPGRGAIVRVDLSGLKNAGVIDGDAQAVSTNITAVNALGKGFIAAYPFGTENPGTSTLNVDAAETRGIGTMVKLGTDADGSVGFNVYVDQGAHLVIDVAGFMTGEGAARSTTGLFVPLDPARLLDTRRGDGGKKRLWPGWSRAFTLPNDYAGEAQAVVMNLAVARTMGRGYFTMLAAQTTRELVSNLNVIGVNQTVSNHVITQASTNGVECFSSAGGDVICDVVGYFKGSPVSSTLGVPVDPPPPAAPTPYYMTVPRLGLGRDVLSGSSDPIVDSGKVWHWTGTGFVGQGHTVATFAHRTEAGGPLRQIHTMVPGDRVTMNTNDFRLYTYEYDSREVTSKQANEILASTQRVGGESLSIVACTVGFDSSKSAYPDKWAPTSLEYRIVVRCRLIGWEDIIPLI